MSRPPHLSWFNHPNSIPTPSSAEFKITWSYTSTHPIRLYGMVLS
jgi:hypothetical protein